MTKKELINKDYYSDVKTAINALKFIDSDYARLAIDLEYGVSLNMNPYPFNNYDNGGYPVMFIHYDREDNDFWFTFMNVADCFIFPWEERTSMTKEEITEAGYYFQEHYYVSQEEEELLPF